MSRFAVRFMKMVADDTGHDHYVCQFATEVDAHSEREAVLEAEKRFCRDHHICDWSTHADTLEISPLSIQPESRAMNLALAA